MRLQIGDCVVMPVKPNWPGRLSFTVPNVVDDKTVPQQHTLAEYFWYVREFMVHNM